MTSSYRTIVKVLLNKSLKIMSKGRKLLMNSQQSSDWYGFWRGALAGEKCQNFAAGRAIRAARGEPVLFGFFQTT